MTMISRFTRVWTKPIKHSCPIKCEFELVTQIEPISFSEDKKTVKEYKEIESYNVRKTKWKDYIKSFDLGSPSEQVMNHLQKGTPLVTAHTLPYGDYTPESLKKGAEIRNLLNSNGITLDQIESYLKSEKSGSTKVVEESKAVDEAKSAENSSEGGAK